MLIGYLSDEQHVAIAGAWVTLENESGRWDLRSQSDGALLADVAGGEYQVTLNHADFGGKRVTATIREDNPCQFRLLSESLVGYMWPKWVRVGQGSEYRIHSSEPFRLDLYRYGWEKKLVRELGWCDEHGPEAMRQVAPDTDFTRTGMQWNQVGHTIEFQKHRLEAPAESGLYFLHARTASGRFFSFPWIVSPAEPCSEIAVMTSNITWNAYNNYGGRSNYFNQDGLRDRPVVYSRQDIERYTRPGLWPYEDRSAPLSFERPELASCVPEHASITDTISGRMQSAFAPGEWRLLGWLEREKFSYDLYSETELHFGTLPLEQYRVLVLNTHPEYWSVEMYQRVKRWVHEEGGRLVYLAGCGLYAEVEFVDESTMLCCREGETELRGESEASLLGVAYSHDGFQSGAPYRVLDGDHWVFEGTGLETGSCFGFQSLHERCPGGASGHELDKIGPASPAGLQHLAKGDNPGGSGADMVLYQTASGGAVFSAGSLCWTLSIPVDDGVSKVTANVLRRFLDRDWLS